MAANLSDLEEFNPSNYHEKFPIDQGVSPLEIREILWYIPNKKAPGPDKIPNKALKLAAPLITPAMASLAESCFKMGFLPTPF